MFRRIVAVSILLHVCFANVEAPFQAGSSSKGLGDHRAHGRSSTLLPRKSSSGGASKSNKSKIETKRSEEVSSALLDISRSVLSSDLLASSLSSSSSEALLNSANPKSHDSIGTVLPDEEIFNPPHDLPNRKSKKNKKKKISRVHTTSSTQQYTTTKKLRLQREWKDTVAAGMGFDWKKGRPFRNQHGSTSSSDDDDTPSQPSSSIWLGPIRNMDQWHFSFVGFGDPYETGVYHGIVVVPADYPHGPPRVQLWTPSGRFQTHKNLCLDISHYHPESWRPTLSIRSLVESVRLHMTTPADSAIGSLGDSYEKRKHYARASRRYLLSTIPGGSDVTIDHGNMIRNGWMKGIQPSNDDDDVEDKNDIAAAAPSSTLLQELLLQKPLRLFLVGAFCLLFLVLHMR